MRVFVEHDDYAPVAVTVQTDAENELTIQVEAAPERQVNLTADGVHVRILDAAGAPLMDDRMTTGAMRFGYFRGRIPRAAHTVETYRPGATAPCATGTVSPSGAIVLQPN